jgi:hypothetical protein
MVLELVVFSACILKIIHDPWANRLFSLVHLLPRIKKKTLLLTDYKV